jgi:long-chain fatty acid transport protein
MKRIIRVVLAISLASSFTSNSWAVGASGFSTQLVGAKALGQGNAFAGEADDPSALYFNPAGITQLKGTQLSVGGTGLIPIIDRTGAGVPDDPMKREVSVIPNFYLTQTAPYGNDKVSIGVGLTSPFGVTTEWAPTSSVRYVATTSKFEMVNVNPSVAYKVTDELSLGAGVDYMNVFNTEAESQTNQAAANLDNSPDGTSNMSGHGSGWGYNVGVLYKPVEKHSVGLAYRSQVHIPIRGNVVLSNLSASSQANYNFARPTYSADATSSVILPASVLAGYAFKPNSQWTLLADYEWTQWNVFQNQSVAIHETDPNRLAFLTGSPTNNVSTIPRNWRNVSAVGLGANFKQNDHWQWRGGYSFFQRTVPSDTFTPDIPDSADHVITTGFSRTWESIILDCAMNLNIYANRTITNTVGNTVGASVNGTYKTIIPIVALNLTYKFGP